MEEQKHSRLGIASFILSVIGGMAIVLTLAIAGVLQVMTPGGLDQDTTKAAMVGFAIFGCLGIEILAIAIGLASLLQRDRDITFGLLGTAIALAGVTGAGGLTLFGILISQ